MMNYKPIGKQKILEELASTNLALKMNGIDESEALLHLKDKLADYMQGQSMPLGVLLANAFFIGREHQKTIVNQMITPSPGKEDLAQFIEALIAEYDKHYYLNKQGDSWKYCDLEWLEELATKAIWEIVTPENILFETNPDHLLDIANFLAFLWIRYQTSQDCAALRREPE